MPADPLTPSTPAEEIFDDTFRAEAIVLTQLQILQHVRAFEPATISVSLAAPYIDAGLVPPLEMIIAAPNGRHTQRTIDHVPLAVIFTPDQGGRFQITLREQAHNQWHGSTTVDILGDPER